jgi:hypothetical protein
MVSFAVPRLSLFQINNDTTTRFLESFALSNAVVDCVFLWPRKVSLVFGRGSRSLGTMFYTTNLSFPVLKLQKS